MFLSNKQIFQILSPFIVGFLLLFFQDNILGYFYNNAKTKENIMDKKLYKISNIYIKISKDIKPYGKILEENRKIYDQTQWLCENILYKKEAHKTFIKAKNIKIKKPKNIRFDIKAIYPKEQIAIVNSKLVHTGSIVNGVKIIKIYFDKIKIKTEKGIKWVYLYH